MKHIGIDLGSLENEPAPLTKGPVVPSCPGARLRVTRADYDDLSRRGERFASKRDEIPYDGMGDARVLCTDFVAEIPKTCTGNTLFYGLCHSCSGIEADNRRILRERTKTKGDR